VVAYCALLDGAPRAAKRRRSTLPAQAEDTMDLAD
jgi:hypothetical protein